MRPLLILIYSTGGQIRGFFSPRPRTISIAMVIDLDAPGGEARDLVDRCACLLADAFLTYPEYLYLFPEERTRRAKLRVLFTVMTRYCLSFGKVIASSDRIEAVLMYLPPPASIRGWHMVRCGALGMLPRLGPRFLPKQNRIISTIARARSTAVPSPHAYLFLLATDPAFQKAGHATALMQRFLERLDASGLATYLETSHGGNVGFYQRFGFDIIDARAIKGAGITIHAMVRGGKQIK